MFEELRFRWALRRYLKERLMLKRSYENLPDDDPEATDEPRIKWTVGRELGMVEASADVFRSKYLVERAYAFHVPLPNGEDDWEENKYSDGPILSAAGAQKVRNAIRSEQKSEWEYWSGRVTLALALVGSIFGVLAFFRK